MLDFKIWVKGDKPSLVWGKAPRNHIKLIVPDNVGGGVAMYCYGEDFNEERELDALMAQFLQKKRSGNDLILKEALDAKGTIEKNT